ncbi:3-hydroxyacyl-CoA dehydrogenase NAD-binding domain-containing protein [Aquabacterium sp. A7-Y]|uniref:3-hydroxyacyl-CoA dehydrogenase NAD-binding domain-containing protein n=1 Tax=Aquabacterium sp. A7-Y TaxID=1349605 RepID=UPI00223D22C7|nr:3-hydroxyacyl-CoA dehydrogenase NAD-binding domain-containing protein [Aquabacterium sp. A7-Y]MCW7541716.1 3-hydroxyacyl-CoA dehydrogenase NAD-binding domain-containing protein [Aquabacterium sp. A7-Y]
MAVDHEVRGEVVVIRLAPPPEPGAPTRRAVATALAAAEANRGVRAIVLLADEAACLDLDEGGPGGHAASLAALALAIENARKPVVAALHGRAVGPWFELALACHDRIAAPGCELGLDEVRLGGLPSAGGTQRLPRLVGVEPALNMILSALPVSSEAMMTLPRQALLCRLASSPDTLVDEALARALELAASAAFRRTCDLPCRHPMREAYFQFARNMTRPRPQPTPAALLAIDAVEAATGSSFALGLAEEQRLAAQLIGTPAWRALHHAARAERLAAALPDMPADMPRRSIAAVAVIGAGLPGEDIAATFRDAGVPVTPVDLQQLCAAPQPADLARADLVIEAVPEDAGAREALFRHLGELVQAGTILAVTTPALDLDAVAALTRRPQDVVGLHFSSPARRTRLLEVVRGRDTAPDVIAPLLTLARRLRKTAVFSSGGGDGISARLLEHYGRQVNFLLARGTSPQQLDRALEAFGFGIGPCRVSADEPGLRGTAARTVMGPQPRPAPDEELVDRLLFALVNEGARMLEEGSVARASDIDLVCVCGHGFPAHRGGPMFHADEVGLHTVLQAMRRFQCHPADDAAYWEPAPLLARLAAGGQTFHPQPRA